MELKYDHLKKYLEKQGITHTGVIRLSDCRIIHSALLERSIASPKTVIMMLIPYYTGDAPDRNLSLYAVPRDYHLFLSMLSQDLTEFLTALHPGGQFAVFADHSPIDERVAAARCGLGVLGDNGLILSPIYGSYVFLAEIITDLDLSPMPEPIELKGCLHCGACKKACPSPENCLSAITQRKGTLLPHEEALMRAEGTVWGCDACQRCCPMNQNAKQTDIPFFHEKRIFRLTPSLLAEMSEEAFKQRAFSWRGRSVVQRNLDVLFSDPDRSRDL